MGEASFTPGPWVFGNTSAFEWMLIGRGGKGDYVCHVTIQQCGGGAIASAMEPARRANARLIAAAPDLYEAVNAFLAAGADAWPETALREAERIARAALAKANGETVA